MKARAGTRQGWCNYQAFHWQGAYAKIEFMKLIDSLDISPTFFGVVAIYGFHGTTVHSNTVVNFELFFAGAVLSLVSALISVTLAVRRHKFSWLAAINTGWLLLALGAFVVMYGSYLP